MPNSYSTIILVLLYYCRTRRNAKLYYRIDELLKEFEIELEKQYVENHLDILLKDGCLIIVDASENWIECYMQLTPKGINLIEGNTSIVKFAMDTANQNHLIKFVQ